MKTKTLIAYMTIAAWVGGLWQGATHLALDGRWIAVIPIAISAVVLVVLRRMIHSDQRDGTLK